MRLLFILLIFSVSSCSVKKQVSKTSSVEQTDTSEIISIKESIKDSVVSVSSQYEIEVIANDSLKPIQIDLGGVTQTFYNAKKVVLRKKKDSVVEAKNRLIETDIDKQQSSTVEKKQSSKDVKRVNYTPLLWLGLFIFLILLVRKEVKSYL
jgi:hypothetical protein